MNSYFCLGQSCLDNNTIILGLAIIFSNFGGKYLIDELADDYQYYFKKYSIIRRLTIFSIFYIATRNFISSILLLVLYMTTIYFINTKYYNTSVNLFQENEYESKSIIYAKY